MACYKCFYLLTYWHKQYIKSKSSTNRKKILMSSKGLNIAAHIITQGKAVISHPDSSSIRDASSIKIQPGLEPVGAVAGARLSDRLSPTRSSPADWSASLLPDVPTSAATFLHAVPPPTSDAHKMSMWSWVAGRAPGLQKLWRGAGVVIWLQRGANLHMAQLMPLPEDQLHIYTWWRKMLGALGELESEFQLLPSMRYTSAQT